MCSIGSRALFLSVLVVSCFRTWRYAAARLPQAEVDALQQIAKTMGSVYWKFNADSCQVERVGVTVIPPNESKANITCACNFQNNTCHIVAMEMKRLSLPGTLPPELVKLPYLQYMFLSSNWLSGNLPAELAGLRNLKDL
ncbi:hypothetical protein L1049_010103 [Liquidambar formosana]|uniref:LRR receptor-like serine/threonine-protein kinase n=1 Tax=Liquidambar formosana TaxID=63359 RepID=A0AAP0R1H9_LIQFO